ncbi:hypothetical protein ACU82A_32110 [Bacillus cereus]
MELQLLNKIIEQLKIKENKSKDLRTICSDINAIAAIIMAILLSQGYNNAVPFWRYHYCIISKFLRSYIFV